MGVVFQRLALSLRRDSASDDDIWGARDETVSEDLELRAGPSFFMQETVALRYNCISMTAIARTKQWRWLTFA
jgi:hypothetical protein